MNTRKRWLVPLLATSLVLNLFFVGFGLSRHLRRLPPGPPSEGMFHLGRVLGTGDKPELERVMRQHMEGARPHRRALREARREVRRALEAEPFDSARLESALAALREHSARTQQAMHAGLCEIAESLGPEERRRLAEANLRPRPRRRD